MKDASGRLNEVPILIGTTYYKRFTPSQYNSIQVTLVSVPPLKVPYFTLTNQSPALLRTISNA